MKILVVTTSRADWNSLGMVAKALHDAEAFVVVAILSDHAGYGWVTEEDWDGPVVTLVAGPTLMDAGTVSEVPELLRTTRIMRGMAMALSHGKPDVVLLCGDRHETLSVAFAAAMAGVPIAHLAGGDVSGGSDDEKWRHAITKLSTIHFPTHAAAAQRVMRMGEEPIHVHNLGSASIDRMLNTDILDRATTLEQLGLPDQPFLLFNWQPDGPSDPELPAVLEAIRWRRGVAVGMNPDPGVEQATALVRAQLHPNQWSFFDNLPPQLYLSALHHCLALVGNSSSGFYEAPYYGTPVLNIGTRQQGRGPIPACMTSLPADVRAITTALDFHGVEFREVPEYPFGLSGAARGIADKILSYEGTLPERKLFHDGR